VSIFFKRMVQRKGWCTARIGYNEAKEQVLPYNTWILTPWKSVESPPFLY
jgi:hypothetical protein